MTDKFRLTKTAVEKIPAPDSGQSVHWDADLIGFGVRVSPGGTRTFFYQGRLNGKTKKITVGKLGKITGEQARKKAREYEAQLTLGNDPTLQREGKQAATLGDILTAYCDLLEARGKESARSVRNAVEKRVRDAHKRLWNKPANEVTLDELVALVGKIKDEGHARAADLVRSYIKSAYTAALNARGNPDVPQSMRNLGVTQNPARDIQKVKGSSNARDRALTLNELQAYWQHVQELPEPRRSVLTIHLLTGGQRLQQIQRATLDDIDPDTQTLTLWDSKGRREQPRRHVIPLLPTVQEAIGRITGTGRYIMSANGGKSPFHSRFMSNAVNYVRERMEQEGELEKGHFTPGSIRATVETRLIAKPYRVSSDVLAQLLSHGMGGVQARHYQHHDFMEEKLEALEKLERMAKGEPEPVAEVIEMRARA